MIPYNLAQLNIGKIKGRMESEVMYGFASRLEEINALAEAYPGFIWRLQDESGSATNIHEYDDPFLLINMSVWKSVESLKDYTYHTMHKDLLKDRKQWFHRMEEMHYVLWWVAIDHIPTVAEAKERLEHLQTNGHSGYAFDFKHSYPPPP